MPQSFNFLERLVACLLWPFRVLFRDPATPEEKDFIIKKKSRFDTDKNYFFPSLYDEVNDMMNVARFIYNVCTLRDFLSDLAREIADDQNNLSASKFRHLSLLKPDVDENTNLFTRSLPMSEIYEFLRSNLDEFKKSHPEWSKKNEKMLKYLVERAKCSNRVLLYIEDCDGDEEEATYSLSVDHVDRRIVVSFRGTAVLRDIREDIKLTMLKYVLPNCAEPVELHSGFHEYLFNKDMYQKGNILTEEIDKYTSIMTKIIPLLKEHKGYKLYVSGHSLGAALSTLFAFCAAQDDDVPKPVTCVNIASPYVGGSLWRKQVMALERKGMLRLIRVCNSLDIVPHVPACDLFGRFYKHVGLNLRLQRESPIFFRKLTYSFQYPTGYTDEFQHALTNTCCFNLPWCRCTLALKMHSNKEYFRRLEGVKDELNGIYVNDIYEAYFTAMEV